VIWLAFVLAVLAGTPVAVTIDDLPFVGNVRTGDTRAAAIDRIVAQLSAREVPATGFENTQVSVFPFK